MDKRMINEARRPADVQHGRHKFKGLRYDKNGNPVYTHPSRLEDPDGGTLSDNDLKSQGWKYSKKHGLHGQISDPTSLPESKNMNKKLIRLTESDLHKIVKESVQKILKEMSDDDYPRLSVEKSRPGDIPPGDQDIYYPGDINPDVWDALARGDYGRQNSDLEALKALKRRQRTEVDGLKGKLY